MRVLLLAAAVAVAAGLAAVPAVEAQAFASAGSAVQAVAGGPGLPCVTNADISPWGQPALLFGVPQGLLSTNNKTYADAKLCCGGLMAFSFTRPHGIYQLKERKCPTEFTGKPAQGQQLLSPVAPSGSATIRFNIPGTYYITSPHQDDCKKGMLFAVEVEDNCGATPGNPQAAAAGPPGQTSTSTSSNSAAASSGPGASSNTSPDSAQSSSGGRRLLR